MNTFKQENIDGVVREISKMRPEEIAELILDLRFDMTVRLYERDWLDELATRLRDGDSFSEMQLHRELYAEPKQELIQRYKNA